MSRTVLASACGFLLLVLATTSPPPLEAQSEKKASGRLPTYWRLLGLSREQTERVYEIQGNYERQIRNLEAQIEQLREKQTSELFTVLTESQRQALQDIYKKKIGGPDVPSVKTGTGGAK